MATKYAWGSQPSPDDMVIQVKTPEGITLTLCKADIVNEQVAAVVNPCNCDLQLTQGSVSSTLLSVGGPTLQGECSTAAPNGVKVGEVVLTSGGQLKCQHVIHGACCSWSDGSDNCKQTLQMLVVNILQTAHSRGLQSVALPALGTGQHRRIPPHLVATVMVDQVQRFSRQNAQTPLRDIRIVCPNIDQVLWAFEEVLLNGSAGLQDISPGPSSGGSDEVQVVGAGTVKTNEGIAISVCKSEIARQQVSAIVNIPGRQLQLSSCAVSKSLVKIGGHTLQQECARNAPNGIEFGEVVLTSGGHLQCDYVVHGACCTWREGSQVATQVLRSLMANSLLEIHNKKLASIAFPSIGTGHRHFPPEVVAGVMLEEVIKFSRLHPNTPLKDVRFVLYPSDHQVIQAFNAVLFSSQAPTVTTLRTPEGIVLSLHKSTIADEQVDVIVNTPTRKLNLRSGALSGALLKAAGRVLQEECRQNAPAGGIQYGETVVTSGGRLRCRAVVHGACCDWIDGPDVCKEVLRKLMSNIIMEVHSKSFTSVAFPSIGTGVRNFPPHLVAAVMLQELIKFSLLCPQSTVRDVRFVVYPKDYETVQAFEEVLQGSCGDLQRLSHVHPLSPGGTVSRTPLEGNLELPSNWTEMAESEFVKLVNLASGSSEFQEVKNLMLSTAQNKLKGIHKIERIQNPSLYLKYMVHKQEVKKRCGESALIERSLWHGTSEDAVSSINQGGFNRSYCGKNATAFGKGVYFAVNSSYSCGYANPRGDGKKQMYLALVLTGDYTLGTSSYRVTPDNPDKPGFKYDSVVDKVSNPSMFVVFLDNQAYPKYLITFD